MFCSYSEPYRHTIVLDIPIAFQVFCESHKQTSAAYALSKDCYVLLRKTRRALKFFCFYTKPRFGIIFPLVSKHTRVSCQKWLSTTFFVSLQAPFVPNPFSKTSPHSPTTPSTPVVLRVPTTFRVLADCTVFVQGVLAAAILVKTSFLKLCFLPFFHCQRLPQWVEVKDLWRLTN